MLELYRKADNYLVSGRIHYSRHKKDGEEAISGVEVIFGIYVVQHFVLVRVVDLY